MKKVKAVNGYTIYEATERDEKKYKVEAGYFYVYFSSDIRDFGITYSYPEMECGSIEEAESFCSCSDYAVVREALEEESTCVTYEDIENAVKARNVANAVLGYYVRYASGWNGYGNSYTTVEFETLEEAKKFAAGLVGVTFYAKVKAPAWSTALYDMKRITIK